MAGMAEALPSLHMKVDVVPARGGFGNRVEYLPNFVAARMAENWAVSIISSIYRTG